MTKDEHQEMVAMMMERITNGHSPKFVAMLLWNMDSEKQAEVLQHLSQLAGNQHRLMTQGIYIRNYAEEANPEALEAYQSLFSAAYKYMGV